MEQSFINITDLDTLLKKASVNVTPLNIPISSTLQSILKEFKERDYQGLIVGGSVRDALIGYPSKDVDIEVYGITLNNLLEILNRHGKAHLEGKSFGVIKFRDEEGNDYDFSVPRRDSKVENDPRSDMKGRGIKVEIDIRMHPAEASLRRDYTINSMAYDPLSGEFHDYHGGAADLKAGILRATDYNTFSDDPLRTLRGMQFCGRFNLTAEPNTVELCKRLKSTQLQRDRVRDEWMKFFGKSKVPSKGFQFLIDTEWIDNYPELKEMVGVPQDPEHHPEGVLENHIRLTLDAAAKIAETKKMPENKRVILIASAMCHDLGKATTTDTTGERITSYGHHKESGTLTKSFLDSIGISSEVSRVVIPLVEEHMSPVFFDPTSKKSTIMHLAEKLNHATIEQLENLILADTGGRPPKSPELSEGSRLMIDLAKEKGVYSGKAQNLISGKDLLAISPTIKGNENLGEILKEVRNKQLRGDISNKEEALSYANRLLQRYFGLIDGNDIVEAMGGQKGPIIREILEASWNAQINGEFQNKEEATYWLYQYIENMHQPLDDSVNKFSSEEEEDYRGSHQAPESDSGSPLYDVTLNGTYPEDFYSSNGARYYGDGYPFDNQSVSIVQDARGKSNYRVKVYRAVPDINYDINKKQTEVQRILSYYRDFNFFPMKNEIVSELQEKYPIETYEYDEQQRLIKEDLEQQRDELFNSKKDDLTINPGDWVTINREYAKSHGESHIDGPYKILTKMVSAKDIFTDGNSVHEWGYYPQ